MPSNSIALARRRPSSPNRESPSGRAVKRSDQTVGVTMTTTDPRLGLSSWKHNIFPSLPMSNLASTAEMTGLSNDSLPSSTAKKCQSQLLQPTVQSLLSRVCKLQKCEAWATQVSSVSSAASFIPDRPDRSHFRFTCLIDSPSSLLSQYQACRATDTTHITILLHTALGRPGHS